MYQRVQYATIPELFIHAPSLVLSQPPFAGSYTSDPGLSVVRLKQEIPPFSNALAHILFIPPFSDALAHILFISPFSDALAHRLESKVSEVDSSVDITPLVRFLLIF